MYPLRHRTRKLPDQTLYDLIIPEGTKRTIRESAALEMARRAGKFIRTPEAQALAVLLKTLEALKSDSQTADGNGSMEVYKPPRHREWLCVRPYSSGAHPASAACWFVFQSGTADFAYTPERGALIKRFCAGRPLTISLLAYAWAACPKSEEHYDRNAIMRLIERPEEQTRFTPQKMDSLDDRAIDNLYHNTPGEYARSRRHSTDVLA
jgi:hypothetical protein